MHRSHHEWGERRVKKLAPMLSHAKISPEQGLRRSCSQADHYLRPKNGNFRIQPGPAGGYLGGGWFFVNETFSARFPFKVFDGVRDVNSFSIDSRFHQSLIQQSACWTHKGFPFPVLPISRLFPDKDNFGIWLALATDGLRSALP